jgi:hypothetical protein
MWVTTVCCSQPWALYVKPAVTSPKNLFNSNSSTIHTNTMAQPLLNQTSATLQGQKAQLAGLQREYDSVVESYYKAGLPVEQDRDPKADPFGTVKQVEDLACAAKETAKATKKFNERVDKAVEYAAELNGKLTKAVKRIEQRVTQSRPGSNQTVVDSR